MKDNFSQAYHFILNLYENIQLKSFQTNMNSQSTSCIWRTYLSPRVAALLKKFIANCIEVGIKFLFSTQLTYHACHPFCSTASMSIRPSVRKAKVEIWFPRLQLKKAADCLVKFSFFKEPLSMSHVTKDIIWI